MGSRALLTATILAFSLGTPLAWAKHAPDFSALKKGAVEIVEIPDFHPTQFNVGKFEMKEKQAEFEDMKPEEFEAYLKAHPCPVVIGPEGVPYITDEHHRALAAWRAQKRVGGLGKDGKIVAYMKVVANYSDDTPEEFEKRMSDPKNHLTYLKDQGVRRSFNELPERLDDLGNDSYRSVAGLLKNEAYKADGVFFGQFEVADWMRKRLKLGDKEVTSELENHRKKFLNRASDLLESTKAVSQPWYLGCDGSLRSVGNGAD